MREYTPFALFETTFLLSDHRYLSLPATAKALYVALWARAFQTRRARLPHWYDTRAMQRDSSLDARTVRKCVTILQQKCLIEIDAEGRVNVCGVKGKGRIAWKDDDDNGVDERPTFGQTLGKQMAKERREEKRREEKSEPHPPNTSEDAGHPPDSLTAARHYWQLHFSVWPRPDQSRAIERALRAGVPLAAVRRVVDKVQFAIREWDLEGLLAAEGGAPGAVKAPSADSEAVRRGQELARRAME